MLLTVATLIVCAATSTSCCSSHGGSPFCYTTAPLSGPACSTRRARIPRSSSSSSPASCHTLLHVCPSPLLPHHPDDTEVSGYPMRRRRAGCSSSGCSLASTLTWSCRGTTKVALLVWHGSNCSSTLAECFIGILFILLCTIFCGSISLSKFTS